MTNNNKTAVEKLREKHLISFPITGADGLDYILTMHAAILELDQRLAALEVRKLTDRQLDEIIEGGKK